MIKDIELTGLGNGLVDILMEVREDELKNFDIKKGEMKLFSENEQDNAFSKVGSKRLHKVSGGSAANTMIAFSALGGKGAYKTVLGNDENGEFYANEFKELNIELSAKMLDGIATGTCIVFITPDSERTMHTCLAATAKFDTNSIIEDIIARSQWIYLEGYKFSEESSTEALYLACELAQKHKTKISVTFSDVFITELHRKNLEKIVKVSDLVFCNDVEALSFVGERDRDKAFLELTNQVPNVVMTKGREGSIIKWNGKIIEIPAYRTIPLDTTGAGDMYAGAFLYGIIKTGNPSKAGHLASYSSARVVSQYGARLKEDLRPIKDKIFNEIH